ncbi:PAS domain-containing protein [Thiohalophilus thiocyanatoxydans]|uniref:PAS domain S-box-containing protein n=1 Tax=Thiohalophilus thiocyanatoxydans TaxID=381308 RepID=A0A4R8INI7_9GAMM|nr:PAS domain-containing protein [Thiohalophilus thiocyanatoxydans]TDY01764.1 PAS domain S-box-containing protein [Thiohalophilus thiocyanatoxydans]
MPKPTTDFIDHNQLRQTAEESLKQGTTPPTRGWSISADALALLYRLASTPESAGDALKLLHELQAHQVELDLQHEQLVANEREFARELERYRALFERAPFGYFVVSLDGQVIEANQTGATLFGIEPTALGGNPIDSFLAPASRPVLGELLKQLREGDVVSCEVQTGDKAGELRQLQVIANSEPGDKIILLAFREPDR